MKDTEAGEDDPDCFFVQGRGVLIAIRNAIDRALEAPKC